MRLSTAFRTELSDLRLETYWDALEDLPMEGLRWACLHAVKYAEKFPTPLVLREYSGYYREQQLQHAARQAEKYLPQWSSTPDTVGIQAIRDILHLLGDQQVEARHPAYRQPCLDDPEQRRAKLLAQAWQVISESEMKGAVPCDDPTD
jgi:hypothetical protein